MLKFNQKNSNLNQSIICLSCCWVLGLVIGVIVSLNTNVSYDALVKLLFSSKLSAINVLLTIVFPYLLTLLSYKLLRWKGICVLATCKAFLYCWTATTIVNCFGSAGWLLRCVLIFSNSVSVVFLIWFWIRNCSQAYTSKYLDLLLCLFLSLVVAFIDYSIISPFGVHLLSYY